ASAETLLQVARDPRHLGAEIGFFSVLHTWSQRLGGRLLAELGVEVWIGAAAEIKTQRAKKQKTDRQDAQLLLKLLLEERFPRIWVPSPENRDLRQLLWHRHRLVQMRTRIMNQLQALAMNENKCWKGKLWSDAGRTALEKLPLAFWASRRRLRVVGTAGSDESHHRGVNCRRCARSQEATGSVATDDASWGRSPHGTGLCADHRDTRTFWLRETDLQLRGVDSMRGLQRWQATIGAPHEARQFLIAFLAG